MNGVYHEFGSACRLKIDPQCFTTQFTTTATPVISCGAVNVNINSGVLWADAVTPAPTSYQFEFTRAGYLRRIASPTRNLTLAVWNALPLTCGQTYNVRVRVMISGSTNYCDFGNSCTVSIAPCGPSNDNREEVVATPTQSALLQLFPNPNNGDQLNVRIEELPFEIGTASIDVIDLFGKHVVSETINVDGTAINEVLDLGSNITDGMYMVNVTAGDETFTQRLVIAR